MNKKEIGIVGLGVMGKSIALNFVDKGFSVVGYNRTHDKTDEFVVSAPGAKGVYDVEELVKSLSTPRLIMLMVPAGEPVDEAMKEITPLLSKGDILIDGGNSHFKDTERREIWCSEHGIYWMGLGVSGGEEGALKGPSMMLGGDEKTAGMLLPLLEEVAAQEPTPCVAYLGKGGAGHFVKMIHNGVEYAEMEAIAESYYLGKQLYGLSDQQLLKAYQEICKGDLSSFLIEITVDILQQKDDLGDGLLLHKISDRAKSKGTGRWTVEYSLLEGLGASTISAALDSRIVSSMVEKRKEIINRYGSRKGESIQVNDFSKLLREMLFFNKMMVYSQGVDLLKGAKKSEGYQYSLAQVFRVWRSGCIIRSKLLDPMSSSLERNDELLLDPEFSIRIERGVRNIRKSVIHALEAGIATPVLASSLQYYDMLTSETLPTRLIQAQRDYFGAHLYERVDRQGNFHTLWERKC